MTVGGIGSTRYARAVSRHAERMAAGREGDVYLSRVTTASGVDRFVVSAEPPRSMFGDDGRDGPFLVEDDGRPLVCVTPLPFEVGVEAIYRIALDEMREATFDGDVRA